MDWGMKKKIEVKEWVMFRQVMGANRVKRLIDLNALIQKPTNRPKKDFEKALKKAAHVYRPTYGEYETKVEGPTPKKSVFNNGHSFAKGLEKRGFTFLGGGAFSQVYAKGDSTRVIKVTRNPTDGWINYIKWASAKGYAGTFAPKVFSYKYIKSKQGDFSLAVVERFEKTIHRANYKSDAQAVHALLGMAANDNQMACTLVDLAAPGILKFQSQLYKLKAGLDMHGGNFMVRKDNSLVFTDPVSSWNGRTIRSRLRTNDFSVAA